MWAGSLKWFLAGGEGEKVPPKLIRQILEPWTWDTVPFGEVYLQVREPWTWEAVEPPTLTQQISEPWSS